MILNGDWGREEGVNAEEAPCREKGPRRERGHGGGNRAVRTCTAFYR